MIIKFIKNGKVEAESKPKFFTFPDGQPHVEIQPIKWEDFGRAEIHCSIRNPRELFELSLVHDVVNRYCPTQIFIYWLFGARMDRRIDNNQPETFNQVIRLLSSFSTQPNWFLLDIHNSATVPAAQQIPLEPIAAKVLTDFGDCDIFFPDKGAQDRYKNLFPKQNVLAGKKLRDSKTGKLSGFALDFGEKMSDSVLIFDDLIDAGGTFLGQAKVLAELGYKKLGLYTTHGLYTKGIEVLRGFNRVYSTNSFQFGLPIEENYPTNTRLMLRIWDGKEMKNQTI